MSNTVLEYFNQECVCKRLPSFDPANREILEWEQTRESKPFDQDS